MKQFQNVHFRVLYKNYNKFDLDETIMVSILLLFLDKLNWRNTR